MSRYDLLLNKPVIFEVKDTDHQYFMGISPKNGRLRIVVGHAEIVDENILFKIDDQFDQVECFTDLRSPLFDAYLAKKKLKVGIGVEQRLTDSLGKDLVDYFRFNYEILCSVMNVDTVWKDQIGSVVRFFNINHSTIIPENSYDSFLIALSLVVETIKQVGKSGLK